MVELIEDWLVLDMWSCMVTFLMVGNGRVISLSSEDRKLTGDTRGANGNGMVTKGDTQRTNEQIAKIPRDGQRDRQIDSSALNTLVGW